MPCHMTDFSRFNEQTNNSSKNKTTFIRFRKLFSVPPHNFAEKIFHKVFVTKAVQNNTSCMHWKGTDTLCNVFVLFLDLFRFVLLFCERFLVEGVVFFFFSFLD
jgi:hypothetical protein